MLNVRNGSLLVKGGALQADCRCCDCRERCYDGYTIEICNCNSIRDDDWLVTLNGNIIGTHSAPNNTLAGTVWRTHGGIVAPCGTTTYLSLSGEAITNGTNVLHMTVTRLYFAANFGCITVRGWALENGNWLPRCTFLSGNYSGGSIIGLSNTFSFLSGCNPLP